MSKYNNSSPDMTKWTNWKLCQVVRDGFTFAGDAHNALTALTVLEGRVVRHLPNPDYDERGAPRHKRNPK